MDKTPLVAEKWERDLDEIRANRAAGRVVDGTAMRVRLRASIAALEPATPENDAVPPLRR